MTSQFADVRTGSITSFSRCPITFPLCLLSRPDSPHCETSRLGQKQTIPIVLGVLVPWQKLHLPLQNGALRVPDRRGLPAGFRDPTRSCAWDRRNLRRTRESRRSGGEWDW